MSKRRGEPQLTELFDFAPPFKTTCPSCALLEGSWLSSWSENQKQKRLLGNSNLNPSKILSSECNPAGLLNVVEDLAR